MNEKELSIFGQELKDKYVILKEKYYRGDTVIRVFKCTGGFGCNPNTVGTAVFGHRVCDGAKFRSERFEVERFAKEEEVEIAKKKYLDMEETRRAVETDSYVI
jgi:hypothetical protein